MQFNFNVTCSQIYLTNFQLCVTVEYKLSLRKCRNSETTFVDRKFLAIEIYGF